MLPRGSYFFNKFEGIMKTPENRVEGQPETGKEELLSQGTITIPGRPEVVSIDRVAGDLATGIEFEASRDLYVDWRGFESSLEFLDKGGRIFITDSDFAVYVRPEGSEMEFPKDGFYFKNEGIEGPITIPGKPEIVSTDRVCGDTQSEIMFEVNQDMIKEWGDHKELLDFILQGGRVFVTDFDMWLFVKPKGDEVGFPNLNID